MRILSAMVHLACDHGAQAAHVSHVMRAARVSSTTFYYHFADRGDCLLQALEEAVALAGERASAAYEAEACWVDRVRAGLLACLRFFDESPELAQLCVVQALAGGPAILRRRAEVLDQLARLIEEGREDCRREPSPLTAQCVVHGALGVIHARLVRPGSGMLCELVNPIMSIIVLPYLGDRAAHQQLSCPIALPARVPAKRRAAFNPVESLEIRLTYRTLKILDAIAAEPGLSNRQVSERAGVTTDTQIAKTLGRLARVGLIENTGGGQAEGVANAWRLTPRGKEVERAIGRNGHRNAAAAG
jgi:AcrR family transcriptional regulator/DNA-binding MarR family transcriptional regulator